MNIPGFTAEASLNSEAAFYTSLGNTTPAGQAVTPALPIIDSIFKGARCAAACTLCAIAGGVGPNCWVCRNCIILITHAKAKM